MDIFKGQNLLELSDRFKTDLDLSSTWQVLNGRKGSNVSNTTMGPGSSVIIFQKLQYLRHTDSVTANTLLHKVKFGVRKAFFICFEMATGTKRLSASYMGVRYDVIQKTARLFILKVGGAIAFNGDHPMDSATC